MNPEPLPGHAPPSGVVDPDTGEPDGPVPAVTPDDQVPAATPDRMVATAHVLRRALLPAAAGADPAPEDAALIAAVGRRMRGLVGTLWARSGAVDRAGLDRRRVRQLAAVDDQAARLARYCDSLMVLAGLPIGTRYAEPVDVLDVIGTAASTVEQGTRIAVDLVEGDIGVAGAAADEVSHVLAELLDNATCYSPPESVVEVSARRVGDQAVIRVVDRGVGIAARQLARLNLTLAGRVDLRPESVRTCGLAVVGTLARRWGLSVRLSSAPGKGTEAEMGIPPELIGERLPAGHGKQPIAAQGMPRPGLAGVPPSLATTELTRLLHVPPDL